jgi:hypothetical protein
VVRENVTERDRHSPGQDGRISKKDFMKYFDDELASRIDMRDVTAVQERIKRTDVEVDYELLEELGTGQTAEVWKGAHRETGTAHPATPQLDPAPTQVWNTP